MTLKLGQINKNDLPTEGDNYYNKLKNLYNYPSLIEKLNTLAINYNIPIEILLRNTAEEGLSDYLLNNKLTDDNYEEFINNAILTGEFQKTDKNGGYNLGLVYDRGYDIPLDNIEYFKQYHPESLVYRGNIPILIREQKKDLDYYLNVMAAVTNSNKKYLNKYKNRDETNALQMMFRWGNSGKQMKNQKIWNRYRQKLNATRHYLPYDFKSNSYVALQLPEIKVVGNKNKSKPTNQNNWRNFNNLSSYKKGGKTKWKPKKFQDSREINYNPETVAIRTYTDENGNQYLGANSTHPIYFDDEGNLKIQNENSDRKGTILLPEITATTSNGTRTEEEAELIDNAIEERDKQRSFDNWLNRYPREEGLKLTFPEFDIITLGRSLGLNGLKALRHPIANLYNENLYYRQGYENMIEDALASGVVRAKPHINWSSLYRLEDSYDIPYFFKGKLYKNTPKYWRKHDIIIPSTAMPKQLIVGRNNLTWQPVQTGNSAFVKTLKESGMRATPLYKGKPNQAPIKYFDFYTWNPRIEQYINTNLKLPITGFNLLFSDTSTNNEQ